MPFLLLLLRKTQAFDLQPTTERIAELTQRCAERGILSQTGTAVPSTAATASAGGNTSVGSTAAGNTASSGAAVKTASAAGTAVRSAVKGKIIAGIVAAAIVGGGIGGGLLANSNFAAREEPLPTEQQTEQQNTANQADNGENVSEDSGLQNENSVKSEGEPAENLKTDEVETYQKLLLEMQNNGSFLQFAQLRDLNNDGVDEMVVLRDGTRLELYEFADGDSNCFLMEDSAAGYMQAYKGSYVTSMTFDEMAEEYELEMGDDGGNYVMLNFQYADDGSGILINHDDLDIVVTYENRSWKRTEYMTKMDESADAFRILYYRDGVEIDENTYRDEVDGFSERPYENGVRENDLTTLLEGVE